jgi:hypothetical protein
LRLSPGKDGAMPQWLVVSLVLSIVLTAVVNAVLWLFPRVGPWVELKLRDLAEGTGRADADRAGRVRVIVPWRFMLIASLALTVVINLVLLLW